MSNIIMIAIIIIIIIIIIPNNILIITSEILFITVNRPYNKVMIIIKITIKIEYT